VSWPERRLAFPQVGNEQVADQAAGDRKPVDQLRRAELPAGAERPQGRRRFRAEHAHRVEQVVAAHGLVRTQRPAVDGYRELQAVAHRDLPAASRLDRKDGGGAGQ